MDLATILGITVALGAIAGGNVLEGGHLGSILQPTAAVIVFGGTFGAVAVQFPGAVLRRAMADLSRVFRPPSHHAEQVVATILRLAQRARRDGLVAIEKDAAAIPEPFFRRALELAIDGTDARDLRSALEREIDRVEEEGEGAAKVMEAAGGFAPTVGILGAVLGLIHVMENLSDPSKLGGGIAVAFVATVYGVATANLLYLPMGGKLRVRLREEIAVMELVTEGACCLAAGENPRLVETKLRAFIGEPAPGGREATGAARREART